MIYIKHIGLHAQEKQTAKQTENEKHVTLKPVHPEQRYGDFSNFQDGGRRRLGLSNSQNFIG